MPFESYFPRSFNASSIRAYAPEAAGVFGLSNAKEWLYIGESGNIQSSLMNLLDERRAESQDRAVTGFVFQVCDAAQRWSLQDKLRREYEPGNDRRANGRQG